MELSLHCRVRDRCVSLYALLVCCSLVVVGLVRINSFYIAQDSYSQSSIGSETSHPAQFLDGVEQPLSTPVEAYVLIPQFASLRLSPAADESLPVLHANSSDANRSPPLS